MEICCCTPTVLSSPYPATNLLYSQGLSSLKAFESSSSNLHYDKLLLCPKRIGQASYSYRFNRHLYKETVHFPYSKRDKGSTVFAESGRQAWDFGRFFRTLYFFNGLPNPAKVVESLIGKLSSATSSAPVAEMKSSGVILVTGATGGVGRRVVNILRNKG